MPPRHSKIWYKSHIGVLPTIGSVIGNGGQNATLGSYQSQSPLTAFRPPYTAQQSLADGRVINYAYDSNGNLTSITPPSRPVHGFDYDAIDQQIQYAPPILPTVSQPQTQYEYNLDKKLTKITRPDGQNISFNYDELKGRLNSP